MENFKLIPLGRSGKFAIVDEEDFAYLSLWTWYLSSVGYAIRTKAQPQENGKRSRKLILMHRVVNQTPEGFDTDHINRDKLDNRRSNLRTATRSENERNKNLHPNNISGCSGVTWNKSRKKWSVRFTVNRKTIFLGEYEKVEDAIKVRKDFDASI